MDSACMPFFPLWSSTSQCLLKRSCQIPVMVHQQVSISHNLTNRNLKWWWWFWLPKKMFSFWLQHLFYKGTPALLHTLMSRETSLVLVLLMTRPIVWTIRQGQRSFENWPLENFLIFSYIIYIMFRCAELCSENSDCLSFEFSEQNAVCSFNKEVSKIFHFHPILFLNLPLFCAIEHPIRW